jgi:hypothetical protein
MRIEKRTFRKKERFHEEKIKQAGNPPRAKGEKKILSGR